MIRPLQLNHKPAGAESTTMHVTRARRSVQGFSLVELLLVTGLIMSLAGAMVFNFSNLLQGARLDEGAGRLETLIRFARAQAANTGRKVQIVFEHEAGTASNSIPAHLRLTWEPDPLGQPGRFEELTEGIFQAQGITELVRVEGVELVEPGCAHSKHRAVQLDSEASPDTQTASAEPRSLVTFYPDGTSDSAEIILAGTDPNEPERISLRIAGITGSVSRQVLDRQGSDDDFADDEEKTEADEAITP